MERSTIREDVFIATLAERDKEIAELKQAAKFDRHNSDDWKTMIDSNAEMEKTITELRAALNDAAQGYENLVAIGVLPIAYEEAVQELSNKYRAIAEDTK